MREVVVSAPTDQASAEMAVSILREEGIPARIGGTGIEPSWTIGSATRVNPLRVFVAEEHAARAREILGGETPAPPPPPAAAAIWMLLGLLAVALLLTLAYLVTR